MAQSTLVTKQKTIRLLHVPCAVCLSTVSHVVCVQANMNHNDECCRDFVPEDI